MLEVIYRIYECPSAEQLDEMRKIHDETVQEYKPLFGEPYKPAFNPPDKIELEMDVIVCENKERFKEIIQERYENRLTFARPRKIGGGEVYCIIIGEHAWQETKQRAFWRREFTCEECRRKIFGFVRYDSKISDNTIKWDLGDEQAMYKELDFCGEWCKRRFIDKEREKYKTEDNLDINKWVTPDTFKHSGVVGWVYRIMDMRTDEMYIGQTYNCPVFRWGQHLDTNRFPLKDIEHYRFEILESVETGNKLLDREAHWINHFNDIAPHKMLNKIIPKKKVVEHEN